MHGKYDRQGVVYAGIDIQEDIARHGFKDSVSGQQIV